MSTVDDGGPAFPCPGRYDDTGKPINGFSLRDWFAGQALIGMTFTSDDYETWPEVAMKAYNAADAMLAERAKRG